MKVREILGSQKQKRKLKIRLVKGAEGLSVKGSRQGQRE